MLLHSTRLLAASTAESGAWLNACTTSDSPPWVCSWITMQYVRVAVGLRLGVPLCHPHFVVKRLTSWELMDSIANSVKVVFIIMQHHPLSSLYCCSCSISFRTSWYVSI